MMTTRKHTIQLMALVLFFFGTQTAVAQSDDPCGAPSLAVSTSCSFTGGNVMPGASATAGVPAPGCGSYGGGDVWYQVTVPGGGQLSVDLNTGTMTDMVMSWYTASSCSGTFTEIACNDDGSANGLMPFISVNGLTPGSTIYVRIWEYGGGSAGTFSVCAYGPATPPVVPTNTTCGQMDPICSGSAITFTASASGTSAEPGNEYGCLLTYPNPSWYYLEILNPGSLSVDITAGSDIDFALWGPYADLPTAQAACGTYPSPTDCSYSIAATEQANIATAVTGQVYVLLVTNYANTIQTITVNQASGSTATTNCAIVPLGVDLMSFEAGYISDSEVQLRWFTASEDHNEGFVIERSATGAFWETIGAMTGQGTTHEQTAYSFTDGKALPGVSYYRLLQKDTDGKQTYSNIVSVMRSKPDELTIYPMPAHDEVSLIGVDGQVQDVYIVNSFGQRKKINWEMKNNTCRLNLKKQAGGTYQLLVYTTAGFITQKLVLR